MQPNAQCKRMVVALKRMMGSEVQEELGLAGYRAGDTVGGMGWKWAANKEMDGQASRTRRSPKGFLFGESVTGKMAAPGRHDGTPESPIKPKLPIRALVVLEVRQNERPSSDRHFRRRR